MRVRAAIRSTSGIAPDLRPTEAAWLTEYRAIRAFGWTHDQYMDTPHEALQWLLRIDPLVREYEAEQQEKANRAG